MSDKLYWYKAQVVSVYDGDTITVDIDLGFGAWLKGQKIRLYGIDTPELRGDERAAGVEARTFLRSAIMNREVILNTYRDRSGKYGRWLATVWCDGVNLNKEMIKLGLANEY